MFLKECPDSSLYIEAVLTQLVTGLDALQFIAGKLSTCTTVQRSIIHFSESGIKHDLAAGKTISVVSAALFKSEQNMASKNMPAH